MCLRKILLVGTVGFALSIAHALPSNVPSSESIRHTYESVEKESNAELLASSASMKKALQSHLGIKFWKYIYGGAFTTQGKSGRELTAENCAACAIEENLERVQGLKQREDGFKFVTTLITTIFSPLALILQGNKPGTPAGKTKHGKEELIPEVRFGSLAILMNSLASRSETVRSNSAASAFLQSPYIEQLGELGKTACQETLNLKSQRANKILEKFCTDHAQSIEFLDSVDTIVPQIV